MASVTAQLQLLQQLEGQLRKLTKEKTFSEPAVRDVRKQLRAAAESVVLKNYAVSEEKGIELKLWHQCFHKPVQEVRRRLADAKSRGDKGKELHSKLNKAFSALLLDGIAFYKVFAARLQLTYGDVGYSLSTRDKGALWQQLEGIKPAANKQDVSQSVARCLICLGDLTRYHIQANSQGDWSAADDFYSQAHQIYPQGGNAFNQRAVLAGYEKRDLAAVYHYFRSLSVAAPFTVARENLRQLFEQLRRRQRKLPSAEEGRAPRSLHGWKLPELVEAVELRFLHLQGLLFTQIDFDTFGQVIRAALSELDDLLARGAVVEGPPGHGSARSDLALLQLAAISLFHPADPPDPHSLSAQEVAKAKAVRAAALDQVFVLTGRLSRALAVVGAGSPLGIASSPLMPALCVLLEWLASHPHQLRDPEEQRSGTRSYMAKALAELSVAAAASCEKAGVRPPSPSGGTPDPWPALPEDVELRGYAPLAAFQQGVDYYRTAGPEAEERLRRVAGLLLGIAADMTAADLETTAGCPAARKAIAAFTSQVSRSLQPTLLLEASTDANQEEVIVFQPAEVVSEPAEDATLPPPVLPTVSAPLLTPPPTIEAPAASPVSEAMQVDAPEKLEQAPRRDWDPFGGLLPTIPMSTNTTPEPSEARQPSPLPAQLSQELPSRPSTRASSPPQLLPNGVAGAPPGFPRPGAFVSAAPWNQTGSLAVVADTLAYPDPWAGLGEGAQASSVAGWTPVPTGEPENYAGFIPQAPAPWFIPMHSLEGEPFPPAGVTPADNNNTYRGSPWGGLAATPSVQLNQGAPPPGTATQHQHQHQQGTDFAMLHQLLGGAQGQAGTPDPWAWQQPQQSLGAGNQSHTPGHLGFLSAASAVQQPPAAAPEPPRPHWDAQLGDTSWLDAFEAQQKQLASARMAADGAMR